MLLYLSMQAVWNERIYYELVGIFTPGKRWLDIGCGRGPGSPEIERVRARLNESSYFGVDINLASLRENKNRNKVAADGKHLPFPEESFGLVTSDMVLEHVDDPESFLAEARRVLRPDGVLLLHAACSLHYELIAGRLISSVLPRGLYIKAVSAWSGRHPEDIFPVLYKANTARSLSRALLRSGFGIGLVGYLETPLGSPRPLRKLEVRLRRFLPFAMKASLVALCTKRGWG